MYSIEEISFGNQPAFRLSDSKGNYLQVLPETGANLYELCLGGRTIIQGAKSPEAFVRNSSSFEGARLCPFPSRIQGGEYMFNGELYRLPQNDLSGPNAIHGLLYQSKYTLLENYLGRESAWMRFSLDFEGTEAYPFPFYTELKFSLRGSSFILETLIRNTHSTSIPIGDGWHPYYSLDQKIDKLNLHLPTSRKLELDNFLIPTGHLIKQQVKGPLGERKLDDCFVLDPSTGMVTTLLSDEKNQLTIWQETGKNGYNYLVIYTPENRDRIAIEPMTCAPNAFNNGLGLIQLNPNESMELRTGIDLDSIVHK